MIEFLGDRPRDSLMLADKSLPKANLNEWSHSLSWYQMLMPILHKYGESDEPCIQYDEWELAQNPERFFIRKMPMMTSRGIRYFSISDWSTRLSSNTWSLYFSPHIAYWTPKATSLGKSWAFTYIRELDKKIELRSKIHVLSSTCINYGFIKNCFWPTYFV